MDMNEEALNDFLMHYGVKGMKWGKHASKADYKSSVKSHRKELYKGVGQVYKSKKQVGFAVAGTLLGGGAGSATVGVQMMRGAGYSKGKSLAMGLLGGAPGAAIAIEVKARKMAKED
ncbi:hypothetical protein SEA_LEWANDO_9 [Arthrobacter phage Lewando]|nr:hypothetical protein SEA_LEWANDO_9 [Arthrobacter phage Lewando]